MDQEDKVSKIFVMSPGNWIELKSTQQSQAVHTLEYELLCQPIKVHIVAERYNK